MYRVVQKIAQSLMHRHFATVCSRITRFHQNAQKLTGNIKNVQIFNIALNILCLVAGIEFKSINTDDIFMT